MKTYLDISDHRIIWNDLDKKIGELPSEFEWQNSLTGFLQKWVRGDHDFEIRTSGSTGSPKSIPVLREDLIRSARYTLDFLKLKQGMSALHCLPMEFVAGKMMLLRCLTGKLNCIAVKPASNPLVDIDFEIDFIALTPHQLHSILINPSTKEKLNRIKTIIVGGAALNNHDRQLMRFMEPDSYLTYGMTETLSHIAICSLKDSSVKNEFKLIHEDFSIKVKERGTLCILTPYSHAIELETNDVVEMTGPRSFLLKGRSDNVINSGGIKIHPEEIEEVLSAHISKPFFIAGISSEELGETVALFVEQPDLREEGESELMKIVHEIKIDRRLKPKSLVLIPRFIYTASGKINRKETMKLR